MEWLTSLTSEGLNIKWINQPPSPPPFSLLEVLFSGNIQKLGRRLVISTSVLSLVSVQLIFLQSLNWLEVMRLRMLFSSVFFQEMIDEADRDGDGEINQEEFLRIMKKTSLYWIISILVATELHFISPFCVYPILYQLRHYTVLKNTDLNFSRRHLPVITWNTVCLWSGFDVHRR